MRLDANTGGIRKKVGIIKDRQVCQGVSGKVQRQRQRVRLEAETAGIMKKLGLILDRQDSKRVYGKA